MLVEEALLNEQETLFRFIFAIYLWKNEKTITFVSQIAGWQLFDSWQLFVWYKSDTVVNSWVYCAEYAKNIVLKSSP